MGTIQSERGTDSDEVPGVRLLATFECPQQLLIERIVEIVGDDETPFVDPKYGACLFNRHKARHRPPRASDDDLLSRNGLPQQPREMGLRLVNADLMHGEAKVD